MPFTIRSAVLNDVPGILAIERQAPSAAHWRDEEYAGRVSSGICFVAEADGHLRGFVCAKAVLDEWEIENVVVDAAFLRRGIARALLEELIRLAQRRDASAILLEVRDSNLPARCLYEKCEFRDVGHRRMYYQGPPEDAILYRVRFEPSR